MKFLPSNSLCDTRLGTNLSLGVARAHEKILMVSEGRGGLREDTNGVAEQHEANVHLQQGPFDHVRSEFSVPVYRSVLCLRSE